MRKAIPLLAGLAVLSSIATSRALGNPIDWALYDRSCAASDSVLEVPCGDYGVFHFVDVQPVGDCNPRTEGIEDPPDYVDPGDLVEFPVEPPVVDFDDMTQAFLPGASVGNQSGGAGLVGDEWNEPASDVPLGSRAVSSISRLVPPQPGFFPWNLVIDFDGAHGASTTWLVDVLAGPSVPAVLIKLDDPALSALGEVGDFHLLANLCLLAEAVDVLGAPPPRAVNMSFGRSLEASEDDGDGPDAACDERTGSCQIEQVVGHLHERGVTFVAAAGNHREMLFPAALRNVLAIGMLDVNSFFEGVAQPAWESPPAVRGWIPGNGLCLLTWAAPSGSSYSSAMFTGWLSDVMDHLPLVDPLAEGTWKPEWSESNACYVLTRGQQVFPWCNFGITWLFDGLGGANEEHCWSVASAPVVQLPEPGPPQGQPPIPSLSTWVATTQPTPESDPCIPCVGTLYGGGQSVSIDLSQSTSLPPTVYLDSVFLRVTSSFYSLPLLPSQIQSIQAGTLAELTLVGWGPLVSASGQPSLWYQLKNDPNGDCNVIGTCFWTSTPILLKQ